MSKGRYSLKTKFDTLAYKHGGKAGTMVGTFTAEHNRITLLSYGFKTLENAKSFVKDVKDCSFDVVIRISTNYAGVGEPYKYGVFITEI